MLVIASLLISKLCVRVEWWLSLLLLMLLRFNNFKLMLNFECTANKVSGIKYFKSPSCRGGSRIFLRRGCTSKE